MIQVPYRRTLIFVFLALTFLASVMYDTLYVQTNDQLQIPLAAVMAASFAAMFLLQRYPYSVIKSVAVAAWPLHLFTACFFWISIAFHHGKALDQVVLYTLFAYATYVLVPVLFLLDRQVFRIFIKFVAVVSALLAIPSFFGALGFQNFGGLILHVKPSYADFSGIIASAGLFEHAEGHAYQMAIGLLCCVYILRENRSGFYLFCFVLALIGLVISQGRAAIYGVGIAFAFILLPELFRRSRPVFFGTLAFLLTFPFLILPQIGSIPGVAGYFRVERGLSGRAVAWKYALSVASEKLWTGYGFTASSELTEAEQKMLHNSGFSGGGTTFHNTFISKTVDLGLIATILYSLMYVLPLLHICLPSAHPQEQELVRSIILLAVATAIFRDYNIGGIRSTTMIGTIFLGLANLWSLTVLWTQNRSSDISRPRDVIAPINASQLS